MRLSVDDDTLSLIFELETEDVDLLESGIGRTVLATAVTEIERAALRETAPNGEHWHRLAPSTVELKHSARIGINTGAMIRDLSGGDFQISPSVARWSYPAGLTFTRAHAFHNGRHNDRGIVIQPPRPLIGWGPRATTAAQLALATERFNRALEQPADRMIGDIPDDRPDWTESRELGLTPAFTALV